jgi:hypothetical protein
MNPNSFITNVLLMVTSSHKSRVGARETRQWACPRFIRVVWLSCFEVRSSSQATTAYQNSTEHFVLFSKGSRSLSIESTRNLTLFVQ